MYFNSQTAMRITGVSRMQLEYWDKQRIVRPAQPASGRGSQRMYSFKELVQLKTAKSLREQGLSLQRLRKSLAQLRKLFPDVRQPLSEMTFLTDGQTVFVLEKDPNALLDVLKKQFVFSIPFGLLVEELKGKVENLEIKKKEKVEVKGKEFQIVLTPDLNDGGYSVRCPKLKANSQGETEQEAIDNIIDAIEACLDALEDMKNENSAEATG